MLKRFRRLVEVLVSATACVALGSAAFADPITVTGTVTGNPSGEDNPPNFSALAVTSSLRPGWTLWVDNGSSGFDGGLGETGFSAAACMPCEGGQTISLSSTFSGPLGPGRATINGQEYSNVHYSGTFEFLTGSTTLPTTDGDTIRISLPFTFRTEHFGGYADSDFNQPLFFANLTGSGMAHLRLRRQPGFTDDGRPLYNRAGLEFSFIGDSNPAPTPEPATMTLLGLGLAGLGARKLRTRQGAAGRA